MPEVFDNLSDFNEWYQDFLLDLKIQSVISAILLSVYAGIEYFLMHFRSSAQV
jgi:hypothetical protein